MLAESSATSTLITPGAPGRVTVGEGTDEEDDGKPAGMLVPASEEELEVIVPVFGATRARLNRPERAI
jgi:hypothetical protein